MFRVLGCITQQHDPWLLFLAVAICAIGSYTALNVLTRAREPACTRRRMWTLAAAIIAAASIWSTHFVSLLAHKSVFVIGYDIALTILSAVLAIAISLCAFTVAAHWRRPWIGGGIFGVGVAVMHYIGIAAINATAEFQWNAAYIIGSIAIGVSGGGAALALYTSSSKWTASTGAALLTTLAICGLHFTAMTALNLVPGPTIAATSIGVVAPQGLAIAIAVAMLLILSWGLYGSAIDRHLMLRMTHEGDRLRVHITDLEITKRDLEATTKRLGLALDAAAGASQAKSQFLATMSHELRTPLNAIIGFSEMIKREVFGPVGDPRYLDYVESVRSSGLHLLSLVNDVLDFSKVEAGRLDLHDEVLDIAETIGGTLQMVHGQAKEGGVLIRIEVATGIPQLRGDERRIRQILINIISNAIKFTGSGGQVTVSVFAVSDHLVLRVADTGIGIAAEDIPRVLERFSQVDSSLSRKHEGTGLGLPLAKRLAEAHGGTLTIESTLGVGTTVSVEFPASRLIRLTVAA